LGTTVVNPGAESAAAQSNFDLSTFTQEQYSTWESTGKVPDAKPAESSTAPSTEEPQAGAPEGDEPAAESAPAQSQEQTQKGKQGADKRKAELDADIRRRLNQRHAVSQEDFQAKWDKFSDWEKQQAAKTESAPAKPAAETELKRPARPVFGESGHEAESWEQFEARQDAYVEAVADWRLAVAETKRAEQTAAERQKAEAEAIDKTFRERVGKATEKHADYADVAFSAEVPITQPMDAFIRSQEAGPEVLYYLGQNVEAAKAIAQMAPLDAFYALSKIALSLEQPAQAAQPPKKEAPVVPFTRAAKPATDIRATSAAPVDELQAALEAGDFTAYEEIQNRRDVERRRRG
jgi:hypothetical protein